MGRIAPFPHHYAVEARCPPQGEVILSAPGLESLDTLPPVEFGGPGDHWSPETLLTGALASCFALTFRAIARRARLEWTDFECQVNGELVNEQGNSRFSRFKIHARLVADIPPDDAAALRVMQLTKEGCLISNSVHATVEVHTTIVRPQDGHASLCPG